MVALNDDGGQLFFRAPLGRKVEIAAWKLIQSASLIRRSKMCFEFPLPEGITIGRVNPVQRLSGLGDNKVDWPDVKKVRNIFGFQ